MKLKEILSRQKNNEDKSQAMAEALKNGNKEEYYRIRNSFDSDAEKDIAERRADELNSSRAKETNNSSSSRSSNSSFYTFTPEQRQQKMSDAKKNDRYDMNFLEAIQNTQMSYNRDKSAINSAYNDYLKDPEGFLTMDGKEFYRKYKMA